MALLTKSAYMTGLQCLKCLWVGCHDAARLPLVDSSRRNILDQGSEVGQVAKELFPGGMDIPVENFNLNMQQTLLALKERRPIFEAGFRDGDLFARVDILCPCSNNSWELIEVKSSTAVKGEHVSDVAFQKYVCQRAGLDITRCSLLHINSHYVHRDKIDVAEFLLKEDLSELVDHQIRHVPGHVKIMLEAIQNPKEPDVPIGPQCNQPHECLLKKACWSFLPSSSVAELYRGGQKVFELLSSGVQSLAAIPETFTLSVEQAIQKQAAVTHAPQVRVLRLKGFLGQLTWPLYFMDFETISPAIPLFESTRPYQKIPFQFSLHVISKDLESPRHYSFLAEGPTDPRPAFLRALKGLIGHTGTVMVYNQAFEENVLKDLADDFNEESAWIQNVISRMVDLLSPFRGFDYYHPDQKGSASLKRVLPVLTGKSYEDMAISQGEEASQEFYRVTYKDIPEGERAQVRQRLEEYCALDTQAMIGLVAALRELI